jgi:hypothetical protein
MMDEQISRPELNEGVRRALAAWLKDTLLPPVVHPDRCGGIHRAGGSHGPLALTGHALVR